MNQAAVDKPIEKDLRIIQLRHFYGSIARSSDAEAMRTFSYFSEMRVSQVDSSIELSKIYSDKLIKMWQDELDISTYHSLQTILAVSKVKHRDELERTKEFWNNKNTPWLFLTMINVPLSIELDAAVEHIERVYAEKEYQIYFSLEFNEILVFCRASLFDDYLHTISRLNFDVGNANSTPVLDTVTVCTIQNWESASEEKLHAHISLGITSTASLDGFKKACQNEAELKNLNIEPEKILGRNDFSFTIPCVTPKQLRKLYELYNKDLCHDPWISTYEIILKSGENRAYTPLGQTSLCLYPSYTVKLSDTLKLLKEKVNELIDLYEELCAKEEERGVRKDATFIRIIRELEIMLGNPLVLNLASELAVCLIPQLFDYAVYMTRAIKRIIEQPVCSVSTSESQTADSYDTLKTNKLQKAVQNLLNSFYLDISILVSSTVHSARQFVQIPHCGVTAFEMPPKTMAFYSIIAHRIIVALNDIPQSFYGVMLSPRLVTEPSVDLLPLLGNDNDTKTADHLLSISISERMLYDPKRMLSIFAHEIAHFVGCAARCREHRQISILKYYVHKYLQEFIEIYGFIIGESGNEALDMFDTKDLLDFSDVVAKCIYEKSTNKVCTLRDEMVHEVLTIHDPLLHELDVRKLVFDYCNPKFEAAMKASLSFKLCGHKSVDIDQRLVSGHESKAFDIAADIYKRRFRYNVDTTKDRFENVVRYLFSECYADISMLLLYKMSKEDFAQLYINGRNNDSIEFARFHAVARAMRRKGRWPLSNKACGSKDYFCNRDWENNIYDLLELCMMDDSEQNRYSNKINGLYSVDWPLQSVLIEYLEKCIDEQLEVLAKNATAVEEVHNLFNLTLNLDLISFDAISVIHNLEWAYLSETYDRYRNT